MAHKLAHRRGSVIEETLKRNANTPFFSDNLPPFIKPLLRVDRILTDGTSPEDQGKRRRVRVDKNMTIQPGQVSRRELNIRS